MGRDKSTDGTRWLVERNKDDSYHFRCLDDRKGSLLYLDGITQGDKVVLQRNTRDFSGTRWQIVDAKGQGVRLRCLGHLDGPRWLTGHPIKGYVDLSVDRKDAKGGPLLWQIVKD